MLRTRDPDAVALGRWAGRIVLLVLGVLLCAGGVLAQDSFWQGQRYAGDEPLPENLVAAPGEAPEVVWEVRIAGSTLKPRINNVNYSSTGGGGCVYATSGTATTVWNRPLFLPEGSTVQTLRVYYNDTSASNLIAWFTVYDLFGNIVQEWSASSTGSGGNGFSDSPTINHTIDYSAYSYVVNYRPVATGTSLQFCGVRIFFDAPPVIFIDGFETGDVSRWSSSVP